MVFLRKEVEALPERYPPNYLTFKTAEVIGWFVTTSWERIEAYIRTRYTPRQVIWTIEGNEDDEWCPPLSPIVSKTVKKWENQAWVSASLSDGPIGLVLPSSGIFEITAQVGAGDPPNAVLTAHRKLSWYLSTDPELAGNLSYQTSDSYDRPEAYSTSTSKQFTRLASHAAKAMQNSGAADLLRPYRRQKL